MAQGLKLVLVLVISSVVLYKLVALTGFDEYAGGTVDEVIGLQARALRHTHSGNLELVEVAVGGVEMLYIAVDEIVSGD